jgi:general stress protein YciG
MKKYETYAYLRIDGTPYYIGKGLKGRRFSPHPNVSVPSIEFILLLKTDLTEREAIKHEEYMIDIFGLLWNNTGILENKAWGGTPAGPGKRYYEYLKYIDHPIFDPKAIAERGRKNGLKQKELGNGIHGLSKEENSEAGRLGGTKTKEIGAGIFDPGLDNFNSDKQKERAKILFQCPYTGKISTGGPLALWQKKRGIDHTKNIRLPLT